MRTGRRVGSGRARSRVATRGAHGRLRLVVVGILATLVILLLGIFLGSHPSSLPTVLRGTVFDPDRNLPATEQALNILTRRYFRPLDRAKLQDLGLAGMVKSLEDPYSHYIDPSSRNGSQGEGDEQSVGIGIGVEAVPQGMRILDVRDHSPAAAAGLRRDDVIIKAGPISLAKRDEASGAELIRGRPGTTVSITFLRDGTEHAVNIERAATEVPVAAERMLHYDGVPIGYLRFAGFSEGSAEKLRAATKTALDDHARRLLCELGESRLHRRLQQLAHLVGGFVLARRVAEEDRGCRHRRQCQVAGLGDVPAGFPQLVGGVFGCALGRRDVVDAHVGLGRRGCRRRRCRGRGADGAGGDRRRLVALRVA